MKQLSPINFGRKLALVIFGSMILSLTVLGQTQVPIPKNKKKIEEDLKIGRQASAEVEKQMPILNDYNSTRYIQGGWRPTRCCSSPPIPASGIPLYIQDR